MPRPLTAQLELRLAGFVAALAVLSLAIRAHGLRTARALSSSPLSTRRSNAAPPAGVLARFISLCLPPRLLSLDSALLLAIVALMAARTGADMRLIELQTRIEASIIARGRGRFYAHWGRFLLEAVPIALVTQGLKYSLAELTIRLKGRITSRLLTHFTSQRGAAAYIATCVDSRLGAAAVEHALTTDAAAAAGGVVDLLSNTLKPSMDTLLYAHALGSSLGVLGPGAMLAYLAAIGGILSMLRAPITALSHAESTADASFRSDVAHTCACAEEITFYGGGAAECTHLHSRLRALLSTQRASALYRAVSGVADSMLAKYCATACGFWIVSRPFLNPAPGAAAITQEEAVERYYSSGRMLLNFSQAVSALVLVTRDAARVSALAARVMACDDVLKDVAAGSCMRLGSGEGAAMARVAMVDAAAAEVHEDESVIAFDGVRVATPGGDELLRSVSITLRAGEDTVITGPNGAGKSSLFRILAGLWPLRQGTLTRPAPGSVFYVPQKPYMCSGSLRNQLTYPSVVGSDVDDQLLRICATVRLEHVAQRPGGLDCVCDWTHTLSGGEKQRVALARCLYARPRFAILDECTSAMSVDVEAELYAALRAAGITLLSVSHRRSTWRHHSHLLTLDGQGGYTFTRMPAELLEDTQGEPATAAAAREAVETVQ